MKFSNEKLNLAVVATLAVIVSACGILGEDEDGNSKEALAGVRPSAFPAKNDKNLIEYEEIRDGSYLVKSFATYKKHMGRDAYGVAKVTAAKPGFFDEDNDEFIYDREWGSVDKGKERLYLNTELNIPYEIRANSGDIERENNHYVWTSLISDGRKEWYASSDESANGANIFVTFVAGEQEGKIYVAEDPNDDSRYVEMAILETQDGFKVVMTGEEEGNVEVYVEIEYQKR